MNVVASLQLSHRPLVGHLEATDLWVLQRHRSQVCALYIVEIANLAAIIAIVHQSHFYFSTKLILLKLAKILNF